MRIEFSERFALPVDEVFAFFATPADWGRLYGFVGVRELDDGWYAVGLKGFPFPLVAKVTELRPDVLVRWSFRGFWRGEGEVRFTAETGAVRVEGFEEIGLRWLPLLSPVVERLFLEKRFRGIWALGWRRLRKREAAPT